jgi:uncharacterized membrane protein YkgB
MKKNMGSADRTIRILIAIGIAVLYFTGVIGGVLAIILGIIALVFLITGFTAHCPGYVPLKMTTRRKPPDSAGA